MRWEPNSGLTSRLLGPRRGHREPALGAMQCRASSPPGLSPAGVLDRQRVGRPGCWLVGGVDLCPLAIHRLLRPGGSLVRPVGLDRCSRHRCAVEGDAPGRTALVGRLRGAARPGHVCAGVRTAYGPSPRRMDSDAAAAEATRRDGCGLRGARCQSHAGPYLLQFRKPTFAAPPTTSERKESHAQRIDYRQALRPQSRRHGPRPQ